MIAKQIEEQASTCSQLLLLGAVVGKVAVFKQMRLLHSSAYSSVN